MSDFSEWKRHLNEAEGPGRTKQTAGLSQRIVGIPLDEKSFKIKIIRDLDVIDANGKLTQDGWEGLLDWARNQPKWPPYYPALNDLKRNFFTYVVNADSDRKQVITFNIHKRDEAPGLPADRTIVSQEDLPHFIKDQEKLNIINHEIKKAADTEVSTGTETQPKGQAAALQNAIPFEKVKGQRPGTPIYDLIKSIYMNFKGDQKFASLPVMPSLKTELKGGTLGQSAVTLLKAMVAGFGLKDEYDDPIETVTQDLVNRMQAFAQPQVQNSSVEYFLDVDGQSIFEQVETQVKVELPEGFDFNAFAKVMGKTTETQAQGQGEIVIPANGLSQGSIQPGDETLKKVQSLIIQKFAKKLAKSPLYQKFASYGPDGKYGPTTVAMIAGLKGALGCSEQSGSTITAELIDKINTNKIDESFLGLDMRIVEQFDMDAFVKFSSGAQLKPSAGGQTGAGGQASMKRTADFEDFSSLTASDETEEHPVDVIIDRLNGWVSEGDIVVVDQIIKRFDGKTVKDEVGGKPVVVPVIKKIIDEYHRETGDVLIDDLKGIGTDTWDYRHKGILKKLWDLVSRAGSVQVKGQAAVNPKPAQPVPQRTVVPAATKTPIRSAPIAKTSSLPQVGPKSNGVL